MHLRFGLACLAISLALTTGSVLAQSRARIFDVAFGTPVSALPLTEWVNPACGTNGGPPSIVLASFADFARCPKEADTGLHEVWFIYDDEWEYIGRAHRDPGEIGRYSANTFYSQPIITSLLIDDAGLVQGYRVVTDPRAPVDIRIDASNLFTLFRGLLTDAPWQCADLPVDERERPHEGLMLKQNCTMVGDGRYARAEGRRLLKAGQDIRDADRNLAQSAGDFDSSARLEVFARDAVSDAPCCRGALPR